MKRLFSFFLLLPVLAMAQGSSDKGFTITGNIPGFPDGSEAKLMRNADNTELGKTKFVKGNFVLKGSVTEPTFCYIMMGTGTANVVQVYVENGKINVAKNTKEPGKYIVTGSKSNNDFNDFVNIFTPLVQELSTSAGVINSMPEGAQRDAKMAEYNSIKDRIQNQIDSFVTKKPRSAVSTFMLSVTSQFYDDPILLEKRFNKLDESVRKQEAGKQLAILIANNKIGAIGTEALDFTQPDTSGKAVSLSSLRGKYVLIDFWASWCMPCRGENPNVVENYNKFKAKNFTVLGVSLDRPGQKDKWLQAIKEDNLTWDQVSDLQWWNNAAAQLYHIQSIPQNLLIDPQGKIVAKNLRGPALQAKLCEIFGCN